jgi:hypothetical protein
MRAPTLLNNENRSIHNRFEIIVSHRLTTGIWASVRRLPLAYFHLLWPSLSITPPITSTVYLLRLPFHLTSPSLSPSLLLLLLRSICFTFTFTFTRCLLYLCFHLTSLLLSLHIYFAFTLYMLCLHLLFALPSLSICFTFTLCLLHLPQRSKLCINRVANPQVQITTHS